MNIEIANRLVNLRKTNNYSQEALAEKLGISRQAVSKWERAEASPDTDNLILLARLYGVSLDELLSTEDEIPRPLTVEEPRVEDNQSASGYGSGEYVHVGLGGIHVKDNDGSEVHVGWDGIHVDDPKNNQDVHIDKEGVYVNGEKYDKEWFKRHHHYHTFPMTLLITLAFFIIGGVYGLWHPAWLLFLLIPIWHSFVEAVYKRNAHIFAYPVLATLLFLISVIIFNCAHPAWVIFLTIPLYYSMVAYIQGLMRRHREEQAERDGDIDEE